MWLSLSAFVGLCVGALLVWLFTQKHRSALVLLDEKWKQRGEKIAELLSELEKKNEENQTLAKRYEEQLQVLTENQTLLGKERELSAQRLKDFEVAKQELSNSFKALASETLKQSNTSFLELAQNTFTRFHEMAKGDLEKKETSIQNMVKPVQDSLSKFDSKIQELEKSSSGSLRRPESAGKIVARNSKAIAG
jgi:DNA recombination protein RmuC